MRIFSTATAVYFSTVGQPAPCRVTTELEFTTQNIQPDCSCDSQIWSQCLQPILPGLLVCLLPSTTSLGMYLFSPNFAHVIFRMVNIVLSQYLPMANCHGPFPQISLQQFHAVCGGNRLNNWKLPRQFCIAQLTENLQPH